MALSSESQSLMQNLVWPVEEFCSSFRRWVLGLFEAPGMLLNFSTVFSRSVLTCKHDPVLHQYADVCMSMSKWQIECSAGRLQEH